MCWTGQPFQYLETFTNRFFFFLSCPLQKRVGELFRAKPSPVSQQSFDGTSMRSFGAIPSSIVIDSIKSTPGVNDSPTLDGLASSPLPVSSPVASSFATPDIYDRDSEEIPLSPPQIALAHPEEEVPSSPPQIVNNLITYESKLLAFFKKKIFFLKFWCFLFVGVNSDRIQSMRPLDSSRPASSESNKQKKKKKIPPSYFYFRSCFALETPAFGKTYLSDGCRSPRNQARRAHCSLRRSTTLRAPRTHS